MTRSMCLFVFLCVSDCVFSRVDASCVGRPTYIYICINPLEGCRHGTHTNGTAYIRGTYSRVHTQTHTNTNKHTTWPDKKYGADSRHGGALLIRGGCLAPTPSKLHLCRDLPRRSYVHRHRHTGAVLSAVPAQREPRRRRPAHFVLVLPFR
jgi:hypothetical protein